MRVEKSSEGDVKFSTSVGLEMMKKTLISNDKNGQGLSRTLTKLDPSREGNLKSYPTQLMGLGKS